MMHRIARNFVLALAVAGCSDQLVVDNTQSPDRDRALARPTDVENLIGGQYRNIHNGTIGHAGNNANLTPALLVMGMESFSSNANWGMNQRGPIPRGGIDNSRGNAMQAENFAPFLALHQAARAAALGLSRLDGAGFTFFPASEAQRQRARAVAWFNVGVALGNVALVYDSGAVVLPGDIAQDVNPLVPYDSLMRAAIGFLDSAIAASTASGAATGANGFPTPAAWYSVSLTAAQFRSLANFYKARFRAGVARTPAERAAVNWAAVITEAAAAPAADMALAMNNVGGGWFYRPAQLDLYQSWHQMWMFVMGMADTSGQYDTWLATPDNNKVPFNVQTSDQRFPGGVTRAAQNTASGCGASTCLPPNANQFFRNRPAGVDVSVQAIANSFYDWHRLQPFFNANRTGTVTFFTRAEMDLLTAEAHIRLGNTDAAIPLINVTRTLRGLAAIPLGSTTVPGGVGCVPRVPSSVTGPSACGSVLEAMKWEKRMETAFLNWGGWYIDGRGWGDLPANTPVHHPVPYQELDARRGTIYSAVAASAGSTYGL